MSEPSQFNSWAIVLRRGYMAGGYVSEPYRGYYFGMTEEEYYRAQRERDWRNHFENMNKPVLREANTVHCGVPRPHGEVEPGFSESLERETELRRAGEWYSPEHTDHD